MSGSKIGFNFQTTSNLNLAQKISSKEQLVSQDKVPQTDEYIVKRGDTLTEIAVKTGQNLQELLQKNQQIKTRTKSTSDSASKLANGQTSTRSNRATHCRKSPRRNTPPSATSCEPTRNKSAIAI